MKSFVVSKPVADFLALRRVLITVPEGSTTVYVLTIRAKQETFLRGVKRTTFRNHSPLAVPYLTALARVIF
jgi:hypothetical protein